MVRKVIKIKTYMWKKDIDANFIFRNMPYIINRYKFVECSNPDFILYNYKVNPQMLPKNATKIYMPIENRFPDMNTCDWAFTVKYEDQIKSNRHFRLPTYTRLGAGRNLIKKDTYNPREILSNKKKFCAFIYWNDSVRFRTNFFNKLSKYKKVDAPGKARNNMPTISGHSIEQLKNHIHSKNSYNAYREKVNFLKDYKFCIAFANEASPGYTSEKIYHAMLANCIPIYWGNPLIHRDFNTKSFVNFWDYKNVDKTINRIVQIDKNDNLYLKYLSESWLINNKLTSWLDSKRYLKIFNNIFSGI